MRIVIEGTGDEDIEIGVAAFARGFDEVGARDGAEFRSNEDAGAPFGFAFEVAPFSANVMPGPGGERDEGNLVLLVRLLHAAAFQVFQDHLWKTLLGAVFAVFLGDAWVDQFLILVHAEHAMRAQTLDGEGASYANLLIIGV